MIKIDRTYTITLLDSNVINYSISSNKSCITIDNASGSFNGTTKKIYVTYYVKDLDCFTNNLITISVSNDKGCSNSFTDTLVNECNSLEVSIEQPDSNNLLFNAMVTGGKPPYLYNWIYGLESQFTSNEPNTGFHSQKQLSLTWNHNPANILPPGYKNPQGVRVRVQDSNGCINEALNYYTLTCEPFIASQTIAAQCFPLTTGDIRKFVLSLINSGCGNLVNNPLVINYAGTTQRSIGNNSYEITVPEFSTTSIVLPITVTNDKNVPSNTFNVTVTKIGNCKIKPDCAAGFILNGYTDDSKTLQFDNSAQSIIHIVDFSTDYIDYDTFTFVASAGQVLTNATTLTITNKGVATFNAATKTITYTQTTANVSVIPIKWKVKNDCEIFSQEFTLNINSVLSTAPTVTNLTKTLFFRDTSTTTVTSNNNTTISSLKIITNPTIGTLSVNGNVVTYIPVSYSATNQTVTLQPVNQYGKSGSNFTITYTILSSGVAVPLITCSSLTNYSLFNLLRNGSYTAGGAWTTTSNLQIANNNQVTVTTTGLYNFIYTVTNNTNNTTKATSVTINYINQTISDLDIIYVDISTRKAKITTTGFTPEQLNVITRVNIKVIINTISYPINNVTVGSINNSIIYAEFSLIDEDNNNIIRSNYTSIEVSIPSDLNDCNSEITRIYNKIPQELISTNNTGTGVVGNTILSITEVPSISLLALTASGTISNTKMFNCDGTFTYVYDATNNVYNGRKLSNAIPPINAYSVESNPKSVFGIHGTRIYPVNGYNNKGDLINNQSLTLLETSYWKNIAQNTTDGPCNRYTIWVNDGINGGGTDLPTNKWVGFSRCIDINESKIYYVGLFADNQFKLQLNGSRNEFIINTDQNGSLDNTTVTFNYWHIYPIYIPAGLNTLQLLGLNEGQYGAFGCAIYNNTLQELTNATSDNNLNIIFKTTTNINTFDIIQDRSSGAYESTGYTCPGNVSVYSPCDNGNCIEYNQCT